MSRVVHINVTCPFCRSDQTVSAYTSVNVTQDPHLKTKIFDDNLNMFTCWKCEMSSLVSINLLYLDTDRQFGVWYCPLGDIPEVVKRSFENLNHTPGVREYVFRAPATYNWEEFKSTIIKFEEQKASVAR